MIYKPVSLSTLSHTWLYIHSSNCVKRGALGNYLQRASNNSTKIQIERQIQHTQKEQRTSIRVSYYEWLCIFICTRMCTIQCGLSFKCSNVPANSTKCITGDFNCFWFSSSSHETLHKLNQQKSLSWKLETYSGIANAPMQEIQNQNQYMKIHSSIHSFDCHFICLMSFCVCVCLSFPRFPISSSIFSFSLS